MHAVGRSDLHLQAQREEDSYGLSKEQALPVNPDETPLFGVEEWEASTFCGLAQAARSDPQAHPLSWHEQCGATSLQERHLHCQKVIDIQLLEAKAFVGKIPLNLLQYEQARATRPTLCEGCQACRDLAF
jgi:hypothetical protein